MEIAAFYFVDRGRLFFYSEYMLDGCRIFSTDTVWRQILADMGAELVDDVERADVNFDLVAPTHTVSAIELKSIILAAADNDNIIRRVCGDDVSLPPNLGRVVVALYKSGGCRADELRTILGYSRDAATHAIEAAIYQLRRQFGRDFIQNVGGVYKLGDI